MKRIMKRSIPIRFCKWLKKNVKTRILSLSPQSTAMNCTLGWVAKLRARLNKVSFSRFCLFYLWLLQLELRKKISKLIIRCVCAFYNWLKKRMHQIVINLKKKIFININSGEQLWSWHFLPWGYSIFTPCNALYIEAVVKIKPNGQILRPILTPRALLAPQMGSAVS